MFCTNCGTRNPDSAKFCFACGKEIVIAATPSPVLSVPTVKPRLVAPEQLLPYRWGKFLGWVCLGVGSLVVLLVVWSVVTGERLDQRAKWFALMSPFLIASGYVFVRRRKAALAMTYVWIGFTLVVTVIRAFVALGDPYLTSQEIGESVAVDIIRSFPPLIFWGLCSRYYRKRRPEFAEALGSLHRILLSLRRAREDRFRSPVPALPPEVIQRNSGWCAVPFQEIVFPQRSPKTGH